MTRVLYWAFRGGAEAKKALGLLAKDGVRLTLLRLACVSYWASCNPIGTRRSAGVTAAAVLGTTGGPTGACGSSCTAPAKSLTAKVGLCPSIESSPVAKAASTISFGGTRAGGR